MKLRRMFAVLLLVLGSGVCPLRAYEIAWDAPLDNPNGFIVYMLPQDSDEVYVNFTPNNWFSVPEWAGQCEFLVTTVRFTVLPKNTGVLVESEPSYVCSYKIGEVEFNSNLLLALMSMGWSNQYGTLIPGYKALFVSPLEDDVIEQNVKYWSEDAINLLMEERRTDIFRSRFSLPVSYLKPVSIKSLEEIEKEEFLIHLEL